MVFFGHLSCCNFQPAWKEVIGKNLVSEPWDFAGGLLLTSVAHWRAMGPLHSSCYKERDFSLQILKVE